MSDFPDFSAFSTYYAEKNKRLNPDFTSPSTSTKYEPASTYNAIRAIQKQETPKVTFEPKGVRVSDLRDHQTKFDRLVAIFYDQSNKVRVKPNYDKSPHWTEVEEKIRQVEKDLSDYLNKINTYDRWMQVAIVIAAYKAWAVNASVKIPQNFINTLQPQTYLRVVCTGINTNNDYMKTVVYKEDVNTAPLEFESESAENAFQALLNDTASNADSLFVLPFATASELTGITPDMIAEAHRIALERDDKELVELLEPHVVSAGLFSSDLTLEQAITSANPSHSDSRVKQLAEMIENVTLTEEEQLDLATMRNNATQYNFVAILSGNRIKFYTKKTMDVSVKEPVYPIEAGKIFNPDADPARTQKLRHTPFHLSGTTLTFGSKKYTAVHKLRFTNGYFIHIAPFDGTRAQKFGRALKDKAKAAGRKVKGLLSRAPLEVELPAKFHETIEHIKSASHEGEANNAIDHLHQCLREVADTNRTGELKSAISESDYNAMAQAVHDTTLASKFSYPDSSVISNALLLDGAYRGLVRE